MKDYEKSNKKDTKQSLNLNANKTVEAILNALQNYVFLENQINAVYLYLMDKAETHLSSFKILYTRQCVFRMRD